MRIIVPFLIAATLSIPALAQNAPVSSQNSRTDSPANDPKGTIVITGRRISDLKRQLQECLARKCPPDQDIAATTALAEQQFVDGGYKDARDTLKASLGRNRGQAKSYPVPVANLFRADSRVAQHMGAGDDYRIETFGMIDALKAGLPKDDPRILAAGLEVGDMLSHFGQVDAAVQNYNELATRAHKAGQFNLEGAARLRVVSLYCSIAEQNKQLSVAYYGPAKSAARDLARDTNPLLKPYAAAAALLVARTGQKQGDNGAIDAMIALYRQQGVGGIKPTLVYQPPIKGMAGTSDVDGKGMGGTYDGSLKAKDWSRINDGSLIGQWADISFWVKPDGTVDDVQMLRGGIGGLTGPRAPSKKFDEVWTIPVVKQIAGRRYAPLDMPADAPGVMRVERYSFTAFLADKKNSRIQTSGAPELEMLDLSVDPAPTKS